VNISIDRSWFNKERTAVAAERVIKAYAAFEQKSALDNHAGVQVFLYDMTAVLLDALGMSNISKDLRWKRQNQLNILTEAQRNKLTRKRGPKRVVVPAETETPQEEGPKVASAVRRQRSRKAAAAEPATVGAAK
jgi:hypothetical protein